MERAELQLTNPNQIYRAVTQDDIERNDIVRKELKTGDMAWFEDKTNYEKTCNFCNRKAKSYNLFGNNGMVYMCWWHSFIMKFTII